MNFILFFLPFSTAISITGPPISSLLKRDDYSYQYFDNASKINFQSIDPDVNPIFLSFLLSSILLVLLVCISVATKLLALEREKEYDPTEDDSSFPTLLTQSDTIKNGLWTVNKMMAPDFKVNNTNSLLPPVPEKSVDPTIEEYNKLKEQLESAPDDYRQSFMSNSTKGRRSKVMSMDAASISTSMTEISVAKGYRDYEDGTTSTTNGYRDILRQNKTQLPNSEDDTVETFNLDTEVSEHDINSLRSGSVGIDTRETSVVDAEKDLPRFSLIDYPDIDPIRQNRKSIIPMAMSRMSVMTNDSLL